MHCLLVVTLVNVTWPHGRAADLTSLADQEIARTQRILQSVSFLETHRRQVTQVDSIPLHVHIPQIGCRVRPVSALGIQHLAELHVEVCIHRWNSPMSRNLTGPIQPGFMKRRLGFQALRCSLVYLSLPPRPEKPCQRLPSIDELVDAGGLPVEELDDASLPR